MPVLGLDHATIRTMDVTKTIDFYGEYLGMCAGWRPPFQVGGVWLYAQGSDYPILHVVETTEDVGRGGMFDHIAFRATDMIAMLNKLRSAGIAFRANPIVESPFSQIHFFDPNGIKVELTYREQLEPAHLFCDLPFE